MSVSIYQPVSVNGTCILTGDLNVTGNIINTLLKNALDGYISTATDVNLGAHNLTTTGIISSPGAGSLSEHFGSSSSATQFGATAIGNSAGATNSYATSTGYLSSAYGQSGTADGYASRASQSSVAVGDIAAATGLFAVSIGSGSRATATGSTAIGTSSYAPGQNSVSLGFQSAAQDYATVAIGMNANAQSANGVAIGNGAYSSGNGVGIGTSALSGANSLCIGPNSTANESYITAVGPSAYSDARYTVALGYSTTVQGVGSIAIGSGANTDGYLSALAIGYGATAIANNEGEIGCSAHPISLKLYSQIIPGADAYYSPAGTAQTVDCNSGNFQVLNLGAASGNVTVTFSNMVKGASYALKIIQASGTARNIVWSAVKWSNGNIPTISTGPGAVDIVSLLYDGTNMYGNINQNMS